EFLGVVALLRQHKFLYLTERLRVARFDDMQQRDVAVGVARPSAGKAKRDVHFLSIVNDDEENARWFGGFGHRVRLIGCGTASSPAILPSRWRRRQSTRRRALRFARIATRLNRRRPR